MFDKILDKKNGLLLAVLVVLIVASIGITTAYLVSGPKPVVNTFEPGTVSCEVTEKYEDSVKSNVNVTNTGNVPAFIRVRLVTYRVDDEENHIGGKAEVPTFNPGEGWVFYEGYYYYKNQVEPGKMPEKPLIGSEGITLQEYSDVDGGKQVIQVLAEAIQSQGEDGEGHSPVELAWGVKCSDGRLLL